MKCSIQNDKTIFCFFLGSLSLASAGVGFLMAAGKSYAESREDVGANLLTEGALLSVFGFLFLTAIFFVFRAKQEQQQSRQNTPTEESPLLADSSPLSINDPERYESPRGNHYSSSAST